MSISPYSSSVSSAKKGKISVSVKLYKGISCSKLGIIWMNTGFNYKIALVYQINPSVYQPASQHPQYIQTHTIYAKSAVFTLKTNALCSLCKLVQVLFYKLDNGTLLQFMELHCLSLFNVTVREAKLTHHPGSSGCCQMFNPSMCF